MSLIEIEPGRFVVDRARTPAARSDLPRPYVISDEMPPLEHVDGRFYTSKTRYSAVTRAHGLTEVGNEKFKPKWRSTDTAEVRTAQRKALKTAVEKYRAGHRAKPTIRSD